MKKAEDTVAFVTLAPVLLLGGGSTLGEASLKDRSLPPPIQCLEQYLRDFSQENRQSIKTESSETFPKGIYFHLKQNVENFN